MNIKREFQPIEKSGIASDSIKKKEVSVNQTMQEQREQLKNMLKSANEARAYKQWREEVPKEFRKTVDARLFGGEAKIDRSVLPLTGQFLEMSKKLLLASNLDISGENIDERVKNKLQLMQKIPMKKSGEFVNIFSLFGDKETSFVNKLEWFSAQAKSRFNWLVEQDLKSVKRDEKIDFKPPQSDEELKPSIDETEKSKEKVNEGFYEVSPFYGGYYKEDVFEVWDQKTLLWKKTAKNFRSVSGENVDAQTQRKMWGKIESGRTTPIPLPYDWTVEAASFKILNQPEDAKIAIAKDEDNVYYASFESKTAGEFDFEASVGRNAKPPALEKESNILVPPAFLPDEAAKKVKEVRKNGKSNIAKARELCRFVHEKLEYPGSGDSKYNNVYYQNPERFFESIWQNKKADCDVGNTFAAELLRQAGIKTQLITGHYVKSKSQNNSAVLYDGSGHAWLEAFDEESKRWTRFDATPKGDPDMDQDEQEQDLSDEGGGGENNKEEKKEEDKEEDKDKEDTSKKEEKDKKEKEDKGGKEGDYGEQEAKVMSDEELEKLIKELEQKDEERENEEKKKEKERQRESSPELQFAEEAKCSSEEAKRILDKIKKLRQLKDEKGRNLLEESMKMWRKIVKKNIKEAVAYRGPVRMHEGDELEYPALADIDIKAGEENPLGYEKIEIEKVIEKYFGGFEVYVAADLSGSMSEIDYYVGLSKAEAQRDSIFLFMDSMMLNAVLAKKEQYRLKTPMPVKICVIIFKGKSAYDEKSVVKVVLPITDKWGPAEQVKLYHALDETAIGNTPDHLALKEINKLIGQSREDENNIKNRIRKPNWKMHRFVAVFADGGSDKPDEVREYLNEMRGEGIVVYGFGITKSANAMRAVYAPDAEIILKSSDLASRGIAKLTETIKKWYGI